MRAGGACPSVEALRLGTRSPRPSKPRTTRDRPATSSRRTSDHHRWRRQGARLGLAETAEGVGRDGDEHRHSVRERAWCSARRHHVPAGARHTVESTNGRCRPWVRAVRDVDRHARLRQRDGGRTIIAAILRERIPDWSQLASGHSEWSCAGCCAVASRKRIDASAFAYRGRQTRPRERRRIFRQAGSVVESRPRRRRTRVDSTRR